MEFTVYDAKLNFQPWIQLAEAFNFGNSRFFHSAPRKSKTVNRNWAAPLTMSNHQWPMNGGQLPYPAKSNGDEIPTGSVSVWITGRWLDFNRQLITDSIPKGESIACFLGPFFSSEICFFLGKSMLSLHSIENQRKRMTRISFFFTKNTGNRI